MTSLIVWTNHRMNADQEARLRNATTAHRLLIGADATPVALAQADAAFGQPPVNEAIASERLRWVQLSSAGYGSYDRPDVREAFSRRGAVLTKSSFVYANPCAEHVLAFMLAGARQLPAAFAEQHGARGWPQGPLRERSRLLTGQRVLFFGFGSIGARLSELLAPFTREMAGVRRSPRRDDPIETFDFDDPRLVARLSAADQVVNLLPGIPETAGYFDAALFARFKPGASFYNVGRGTTVDQSALLAALESRHLGAALLDVTDPEPLPADHPLWRAPNCVITPHTAGGHHDEGDRLVEHFVTNFARFERGEAVRDRAF
ncbi:MAG TPA: D-2-hydroxyacid dehydrogenase [Polyangiaceae bacterium]|nr:D-2-hydroxyacid dehydrogenase [Polyangiaceae bacterium]